MTKIDADEIGATARRLRAVLDAIERGDLEASAAVRTRLEGAVTALEMLAKCSP